MKKGETLIIWLQWGDKA